jgi:hypothetical protein
VGAAVRGAWLGARRSALAGLCWRKGADAEGAQGGAVVDGARACVSEGVACRVGPRKRTDQPAVMGRSMWLGERVCAEHAWVERRPRVRARDVGRERHAWRPTMHGGVLSAAHMIARALDDWCWRCGAENTVLGTVAAFIWKADRGSGSRSGPDGDPYVDRLGEEARWWKACEVQ